MNNQIHTQGFQSLNCLQKFSKIKNNKYAKQGYHLRKNLKIKTQQKQRRWEYKGQKIIVQINYEILPRYDAETTIT